MEKRVKFIDRATRATLADLVKPDLKAKSKCECGETAQTILFKENCKLVVCANPRCKRVLYKFSW